MFTMLLYQGSFFLLCTLQLVITRNNSVLSRVIMCFSRCFTCHYVPLCAYGPCCATCCFTFTTPNIYLKLPINDTPNKVSQMFYTTFSVRRITIEGSLLLNKIWINAVYSTFYEALLRHIWTYTHHYNKENLQVLGMRTKLTLFMVKCKHNWYGPRDSLL